jgi:uncharacterized protein
MRAMPAYGVTIPASISTACLVSALFFPIVHAGSSTDSGLLPITTPQGAVIMAELADTMDKRAHGLMFRNSLANNRGMLFTFPGPQPWSFWMKNTRISLDIIWMDRSKKIVHIERRVPTCNRTDDSCPQYQPNEDAMYVLELAAGSADTLHLQRGTVLRFQAPPAPPIKQPYGTP